MYHIYEKMPHNSRVWVYASNQTLTNIQKETINQQIPAFLAQWTAHKQELYASYHIFYDRFLVLAIDEQLQGASGCSIDASVRFVQELGKNIGVDFMCRDVFFKENNETLKQISPLKIKNAVQNQEIAFDTLIFNPIINTKNDLETSWQQKAGESYLKKYFF